MKSIFYILLIFPSWLMAQDDFDSRYYTINEQSLPSVEELSIVNFEMPKEEKKIDFSDYFSINVKNYRSSVDMVGAIKNDMQPSPSFVDIGDIQSDFYGTGADPNYRSDGKTRVQNTVYRDMRGLTLLDPCPPFGVCARCAPYRVGRGF